MTPRMVKHRRVAIIGLVFLVALSALVPLVAPYAAAAVIIALIVNLWDQRRGKSHRNEPAALREHREPTLWDDGFGAT